MIKMPPICFGTPHPWRMDISDDLVNQLVNCCKNHPMALSVVGCLLKGTRKLTSWKDMLEYLFETQQSDSDLMDDSFLLSLERSLKELDEEPAIKLKRHGAQQEVDTISRELFSNKEQIELGIDGLKISFKDILSATKEFFEDNIIARSGFGTVYKGQSVRHGMVAIKKLDRRYGQGDREFMMEISLLSVFKHENIVSLVGFCEERGEKILVYRYEENGSLDKVLGNKDLTWKRRLQICLGAASGLKYLHDDIGPHNRVIHRDVKSANILLDGYWKPKITDFGLSKIALANVPFSMQFSYGVGTLGYVDPQYGGHNMLTQKSDVYSFGVVLFEVLFGRLVTDAEHPGEKYFNVKMAQNGYENKTLHEIIDSNLRNHMNPDSLSLFSNIAYECIKKNIEELQEWFRSLNN